MWGPSDDNDYSVREELDDYDRAQVEMGGCPQWQPRFNDESLLAYGTRALLYVMANDSTALLSDDDLEQAEHAAVYAVCSPDMVPIARAKLSDTRHHIASALRGRKRCADLLAAAVPAVALPERPNEGPMTKLKPAPIVNPPAVQAADIRF